MLNTKNSLATTWIDYGNLDTFRFSVLKTMLLMAMFFSFLIATLAYFNRFPLPYGYMVALYVYAGLNLPLYIYRDSLPYMWIVNVSVVGSLVVFYFMVLYVVNDEFRLVWFFLTVFAAYILGGRRYGFVITLIIGAIVTFLILKYEIGLSVYAVFTFFCALFVFNIFAYVFLRKIEFDEEILLEKVKEEVAKQKKQETFLLRQYRMASMGEMIDSIAHQWRQPLMQSNLILFNMQEELENEKISKKYLLDKTDEIVTLNRYMSHTVDDFRKLMSDTKQKEVCIIEACISEVLELMKSSLKEVTVVMAKGEHLIHTYKNEFAQVCIILLSNSLEIFAQRECINPKIIIDISEESDALLISFSDTGEGIKPEHLEKLFDSYFTTKKQSGDTGLGLYIAKIIIEDNMGGSIKASNYKEGAQFLIRLPHD